MIEHSIRARSEVIIHAWHRHAKPLALTVRQKQIESCLLVTVDQAMIDALLDGKPPALLNIRYGEGWPAHRLVAEGIAITGIDVVTELIDQAKHAVGGEFRVMPYEEPAKGALQARFDAVVCNFSLLGDGSVMSLLRQTPAMLQPAGG